MRHSWACIASLVLSSLAPSSCALSTPDHEGDPEAVSEAAEPLSTSMLASYSTSPLEVTNGKRIVLVGGVFHAVYASGGAVKYVSSTDGVTFTTPVTVDSTSAQNPTIAAASDGTVFVAFVRSAVSGVGTIHLARRASGGSFASPFPVTTNTDDDGSKTPSLLASGNTLYLAWARGVDVKYVSFASSQTTSLASAENVHAASGNSVHQPAVMVGPGASGPIIRVAFFDNIAPSMTDPGALNLWIKERVAGTWSYAYFISYPYASTAQVVSLSADVNPSTGDAYVASSRLTDGLGVTEIVRENTLTAGHSFAMHEIFPSTAALVSVAARTEACQSRFRVVTSTPHGGHGAASYRTGAWTSGASPTWVEAAAVSLPGVSRAGTALLQSLTIPSSASSRFFRGTFEDSYSGAFRLFDAHDTGMTPDPCD